MVPIDNYRAKTICTSKQLGSSQTAKKKTINCLLKVSSNFSLTTILHGLFVSVLRSFFPPNLENKFEQFNDKYKGDFERDFDPNSESTFALTISDLIARGKHWKKVLQTDVEDRVPAALKLEEKSSAMCEFHWDDLEVPGQYFADEVWSFFFCIPRICKETILIYQLNTGMHVLNFLVQFYGRFYKFDLPCFPPVSRGL